jgi:hypothetical protein
MPFCWHFCKAAVTTYFTFSCMVSCKNLQAAAVVFEVLAMAAQYGNVDIEDSTEGFKDDFFHK